MGPNQTITGDPDHSYLEPALHLAPPTKRGELKTYKNFPLNIVEFEVVPQSLVWSLIRKTAVPDSNEVIAGKESVQSLQLQAICSHSYSVPRVKKILDFLL